MKLPFAEPFKIKSVEMIKRSTKKEREEWIKEAKYNLFNLKSEKVFIDLLTDSGTNAMSDKQWSEIMLGDESYAGARSFYKLKDAVEKILGFQYFLPTHQGRAAENVLFSEILKAGDIVPGNSHFDTTKGHIEFRNAKAVDCTIDEAFDTTAYHPFKGNINLDKLEDVLKSEPVENIPVVIITVTCNSAGGQPVSMENIRLTSELCKKYGIMVIFDAARFAENAYFIKTREKGYEKSTIKEIVKEMFSYVDGFTMSAKKDAITNMGGILGFRDETLKQKVSVYSIMNEGYLTYGGLSGRDLGAMAQGLDESTEFDYLESRVKQIEYLGEKCKEYGVPVQEPFGGHAVFVDAKRFLPHIPQEEYSAQLLAIELYIEAGVRGVEIGTLLADKDPETGKDRLPKLELLRLAIPRRVYTNNHMDYIAAGLKNVMDRRDALKRGLKIVKEASILRHFTVELDRIR